MVPKAQVAGSNPDIGYFFLNFMRETTPKT